MGGRDGRGGEVGGRDGRSETVCAIDDMGRAGRRHSPGRVPWRSWKARSKALSWSPRRGSSPTWTAPALAAALAAGSAWRSSSAVPPSDSSRSEHAVRSPPGTT
jgi:hypothetical protein